MKTADVVIGANFGDEGKGLITDYLASVRKNPMVVRYSGGAQAGHTVTTPDGARHIFSHFGSGTLVNADTYLSKYFIVNPWVYNRERKALTELISDPFAFVSPEALVTIPHDISHNHRNEANRKHGSCGMGIFETVHRSKSENFRLQMSDVYGGERQVRKKLTEINRYYVPIRAKELGMHSLTLSKELIDDYIEELMEAAFYMQTVPDGGLIRGMWSLIFEGSQGLLLDQTLGYFFPHLTPSNVGLKNVVELCEEAGVDGLTAYYVTRPYITRHGNGPMPNQLKAPPFENIKDETNRPNEFQGELRFGNLDLDLMHSLIRADRESVSTAKVAIHSLIALTCVDQITNDKVHTAGGFGHSLEQLKNKFTKHIAPVAFMSKGPTRKDVMWC